MLPLAFVVAFGFAYTSFAQSTSATPSKFITVKGQRFIDPEGRQILFHGVSVINKSKLDGYLSWHKPADFKRLHDWGMNCIRLGILWDGVEPEPGKYDDDYLKQIDKRIQWAKDAGLYVFLDMHQDLYSVLYSDGAPEWATLTDGEPHVTTGGVWSDAYFTSPAVQHAFDNFWANKPAADGVGVQDHFAKAWRHVAERYANTPTVLGYDLFNEPNAGTLNSKAQAVMIQHFAEAIAKKDGTTPPPMKDLMQQWMDPAGRSKLMARLSDKELYTALLDAGAPLFQQFERTMVMPMFQRVHDAIRQVDPHHIILLETSMSANMGVRSGIEPLKNADGKRDPQQAYAPHGYDIVVDTPDIAHASNDRIAIIFARHGEKAKELNMPMLVGEWGAYGGAGSAILPTARFVTHQFEKLLCSDTYWEYGQYLPKAAYLDLLQRPILVSVAGALVSYHANFKTNAFTCTWTEDPAIKAPTRIYLPGRVYRGKDSVTLDPAGNGFTVEPAVPGSKNVYLVIPGAGNAAQRTLTVEGRG